jgi:hypothetical protein
MVLKKEVVRLSCPRHGSRLEITEMETPVERREVSQVEKEK